jgi:hypothetical protein
MPPQWLEAITTRVVLPTSQKNRTITPALPNLLAEKAAVVVAEAVEVVARPTNPDPLRPTRRRAPRWAHQETQETQALQVVAATETVTAMAMGMGTATARTEETTQDASTAA